MDGLTGTYSAHAIIPTHLTQTSHHVDKLERKQCTLIPETEANVWNHLLACPSDGGGRTGVWWHVAADGFPASSSSSSHSSTTCGGGHTLSKTIRPPRNQGCRSRIMKRGHLILKFVELLHGFLFFFFFTSQAWSAHQTEGVWKSRWHSGSSLLWENYITRFVLSISTSSCINSISFLFSFRQI